MTSERDAASGMPALEGVGPLDLGSLRAGYDSGAFRPADLLERLSAAIDADRTPGIWIHRVSREALVEAGQAVERRRAEGARLDLYGVPFAVKDNIDVEGLPTTAACPDFAYVAESSAAVVRRLVDAGAIVVGKTNLDQFATGLVGVRSPYGIPPNPFDGRYITGGSSSGSAAAVTRGLVTFALGTDTAGSGRVPALLNNLVGLKPSRGLFSTRGVVPACRSLDCVSVLSLTCDDARDVAAVATSYDPSDPYSRPDANRFGWHAAPPAAGFRFGVPAGSQREFFGDAESAARFAEAEARLMEMGGTPVEIDLTPFLEVSKLLYAGPWIAERLSGLEEFIDRSPDSVLPVIREILEGGRNARGTDTFRALHRLQELKRRTADVLRTVAFLLVPTAPTAYRIAEVAADPILLNSRLGLYTNFVNLLDLSAIAVPGGFGDRLPTGVTFVAPWGKDAELLAIASVFHQRAKVTMGALGVPLPPPRIPVHAAAETMRLAVVGAHLSGEPLNHQLTDLGACLVRACRTAPCYRLYALPGGPPKKPGLVRTSDATGAAVEVEVWELPRAAFGTFFANVSPPLCIGTLEIEDGERVAGFLCEPHGVLGATDISSFGGWRRYLARTGE
jgi:allophanate hydrolase